MAVGDSTIITGKEDALEWEPSMVFQIRHVHMWVSVAVDDATGNDGVFDGDLRLLSEILHKGQVRVDGRCRVDDFLRT